MDQINVEMNRARETKNTWRFEAAEDDAPIDTLYVRKSTLKRLGDPAVITVTVSA